MSNDIEVSVICNTYNHRKYIGKALESFVNQKTNFRYEIIVHDDASTDGTQDIVLNYKKRYPDLINPILEKENLHSKGVPHFWASTYKQIKGKYIALCEGDDFWTDSNKLQLQHDYMESHAKCSLCVHKAISVKENGQFLSNYSKTYISNPSYDENATNLHLYPTSSMFFRKEFYEHNMAFFKQNNVSTSDYVLKLLLADYGLVYVFDSSMSAYRVCSQGSWSQSVKKDFRKYTKHLLRSIELIKAIDEYTAHRHSAILNSIIKERQFNIALFGNDYNTIFNNLYLDNYKKLPLKTRIKIRIKKLLKAKSS